ncbi:hypothetical protein [Bhargavaea beijingensis]|uniref:Uncharacterized protein n=1 Tax=Bhargavaea beijingensis TaxID=426756 RepID=A0ABX9ZCC7_9BACL|nr:hypothetical protein [Bhargavaea beijingensis]RSK30970.1 hypothetical protein EJA12_09645 [Bhargavaea beijingensis]
MNTFPKPKYTTEELKKMDEMRAKWREAKAEADRTVARIRKRCQPLDPNDEAQLDRLAEQLRFNVDLVNQYITEAQELKKKHPNKSAEWYSRQFPQSHYVWRNNGIRDARSRMKAILDRYTFETVDYPDPDMMGMTTYKKRVDYDRIHTTVWKYYNILEETVTLLKKDRDEFIARGGNPDLWMPPF